jgi:prepilin-type N-terminal cleavage/methylation domain-containing protein
MKDKIVNQELYAGDDKSGQGGMTLLEMIVAMLIFTLIIYAVCNVFGFAYRDWADGMIAEQLQQQAQYAMVTMETDVRQARYTNTAVTTYPNAINVATGGKEAVLYEIIPSISTLYPAQVHFLLQLQAQTKLWELERGVVSPQVKAVGTFKTDVPTTWTTLLYPTTLATGVNTAFTIGAASPDHPTLNVSTMILSEASRSSKMNISIVFEPTFEMRGNISLQDNNVVGGS